MIGAIQGEPEQSGFLAELVRQFRAEDAGGTCDGKTDFEVLAPLLRGTPSRRAGDEDDALDVFWRVELFFRAVAASIERRSGVPCESMLRMRHEGLGRLVLVAGRLVVLSRHLTELQRFGFESIEALSDGGERLVSEGTEMLERFPEVARPER